VFYHGNVIFIVYVGNSIFVGDSDDELMQAIRDIQQTGIAIEDQGHPADYVGVSIKKHKDSSYELSQRALIDSIIEDCGLEDAYTKPVPAKVNLQLHAYKSSKHFDKCGFPFNYCSITGKLNYLGQTTRSDILFAVHQISKYASDPRQEHMAKPLFT
jgi:hypothetical protein